MNQTSNGKKRKLTKLTQAPASFAPLAAKINELIDAIGQAGGGGGLTTKGPLKLTVGDGGAPILEIDIEKLGNALRMSPKAPLGAGGGGGGAGGIPFGYREIEIIVCVNNTATPLKFLVR